MHNRYIRRREDRREEKGRKTAIIFIFWLSYLILCISLILKST